MVKKQLDQRQLPVDETARLSEGSTREDLDRLIRLAGADSDDAQYLDEARYLELLSRLRKIEPPQKQLRQVGDYELLEQIGEGGMGVVWRAHQQGLKRLVALKLLQPGASFSTKAAARFQREMEVIGSLEHENIVRAYAAGEADGVLYLAMEYIKGRSLEQLIEEYRREGTTVSVQEVVSFGRQAALGLQRAHEHGVVHRDIKPSNLMVSRDGVLKILDLGLARLRVTEQEAGDLTREGEVVGTLNYMAPEQLRDSRLVGEETDIYALGATMYAMLAGRAPFDGQLNQSRISRIQTITEQAVSPIVNLRHDVPERLAGLVMQMLSKDPSKRPDSMAAVAHKLVEIQSAISGTHAPLPKVAEKKSRPESSTPANRQPLAIVALALLFLGVVAVVAINWPQDDASGDRSAAVEAVVPSVAEEGTSEQSADPEADSLEDWFFAKYPNQQATQNGRFYLTVSEDGEEKTIAERSLLPTEYEVVGLSVEVAHDRPEQLRVLQDARLLRRLLIWLPPTRKQWQGELSSIPTENLESLEIHHGSLDPATLENIGELPRLKSFGRNWTQHRASTTLVQLVKDKTLGLEALTIQGSLTEDIAAVVCDMPKLRSLYVQLDNAPESGLEVLSQSRTLTYIALAQGRQVSGKGLKKLAAMPQLELLTLTGSHVESEFLTAFAHHPIKRLDLCVVDDADSAVVALSKLPNLNELQLEGPNWTDERILLVAKVERDASLRLRLSQTAVSQNVSEQLGRLSGIEFTADLATIAPIEHRFAAWLLEHGAKVEGIAVQATRTLPSGSRLIAEKIYDLIDVPEYRIEKIDVSTTETEINIEEFAKRISELRYPIKTLVIAPDGWPPDKLKASDIGDRVDQVVRAGSG